MMVTICERCIDGHDTEQYSCVSSQRPCEMCGESDSPRRAYSDGVGAVIASLREQLMSNFHAVIELREKLAERGIRLPMIHG